MISFDPFSVGQEGTGRSDKQGASFGDAASDDLQPQNPVRTRFAGPCARSITWILLEHHAPPECSYNHTGIDVAELGSLVLK
ncbi:hypothetical protein ACFHW1_05840 [Micromonospora sp. LOL_014]|uniref:hypothetical protein n=1 Tax=Micromonospora sp. LOL_014 TaxID=3345415 RepID=UPI003A86F267